MWLKFRFPQLSLGFARRFQCSPPCGEEPGVTHVCCPRAVPVWEPWQGRIAAPGE